VGALKSAFSRRRFLLISEPGLPPGRVRKRDKAGAAGKGARHCRKGEKADI